MEFLLSTEGQPATTHDASLIEFRVWPCICSCRKGLLKCTTCTQFSWLDITSPPGSLPGWLWATTSHQQLPQTQPHSTYPLPASRRSCSSGVCTCKRSYNRDQSMPLLTIAS